VKQQGEGGRGKRKTEKWRSVFFKKKKGTQQQLGAKEQNIIRATSAALQQQLFD